MEDREAGAGLGLYLNFGGTLMEAFIHSITVYWPHICHATGSGYFHIQFYNLLLATDGSLPPLTLVTLVYSAADIMTLCKCAQSVCGDIDMERVAMSSVSVCSPDLSRVGCSHRKQRMSPQSVDILL